MRRIAFRDWCGVQALLRSAALLHAFIWLSLSSVASAQICEGIPGLTVNGGFEQPVINTTPPTPFQTFRSNPFIRAYRQADVPGWSTTDSNRAIEIWETGSFGVPAYEGRQFAEINAYNFAALYQDVATTPGTTVIWRFAHRGRAGTDTVRVLMGPPGGALISQGTFSTGTSAWDVKSGSYVVPAGQTVTRFQFLAVSTANGNLSVGNFIDDVRLAPLCDFGDAPSIYPVLLADGGAAHRITSGAFLGSTVDPDFGGQPSADASGDDLEGTDDEDGVAFTRSGSSGLARRGSATLSVTASVSGFINVWVDFNQDGNWDASERLFADQPVTAGAQDLTFTVPASASLGTTFARVRYSTDNPAGALGPTGDWSNGEVEDVLLLILDQAVLQVSKSSQSFADTGVGDGTDLRIPGNDVLYTINVTNIGGGPADADTVFVVDSLPGDLIFFNGDANGSAPGSARVLFTQGGTNLTFNATSDVAFSNAGTAPDDIGDCTYTPQSGYDPAITHICFNPKGAMANGNPAPSFELQFRAQISQD